MGDGEWARKVYERMGCEEGVLGSNSERVE
jgi:hypothetical protein